NSRLGLHTRRDGKRHRQGKCDQADRKAGDEVGEEIPPSVVRQRLEKLGSESPAREIRIDVHATFNSNVNCLPATLSGIGSQRSGIRIENSECLPRRVPSIRAAEAGTACGKITEARLVESRASAART